MVVYDLSVSLLSTLVMTHKDNFSSTRATQVAITVDGSNKCRCEHASAQSLLKQDYKEDCTLKEACGMAVKVLSKTMDSTKLSSEKSMSTTI